MIDRGFVMLNAEGEPVRMVGSIMDVSERRRAETLAHMHQAELAHRSRISTMGEIATGIAHELNQPLTAISNYAESCVASDRRARDAGDQKLLHLDRQDRQQHASRGRDDSPPAIVHAQERTRHARRSKRTSWSTETIELIEAETRLKSFRVRWQSQDRCRFGRSHSDRAGAREPDSQCVRSHGRPTGRRSAMLRIALERAGRRSARFPSKTSAKGSPQDNLERVFDAFFTSKA